MYCTRLIISLVLVAVGIAASSCRLAEGDDATPTEMLGGEQAEPAERDFHRLEVIEYESGVHRHSTYFNGDNRRASDVAVVQSSRYGLVVEYHANGTIRSIGAIENGKRTGLWIEFDDAGKTQSERIYLEGKIVNRRE